MKLQVQLKDTVAIVGAFALTVDRSPHRVKVLLGAVEGRKEGHTRLEEAPRLQHFRDVTQAESRSLFQQLAWDDFGSDEHTARRTGADGEHSAVGKQLDRLPERRTADCHLSRQCPFRRQAITDQEVARPNDVSNLFYRPIECPARPDRCEHIDLPRDGLSSANADGPCSVPPARRPRAPLNLKTHETHLLLPDQERSYPVVGARGPDQDIVERED